MHPLLEMYQSFAIGGLCPIFAALSLFGCENFYEDACVSASRMLEKCSSETGPDRTNHLRGISRADCALDIARCELERAKGRLSRETHGKLIVLAGECYFAICIESGSEFSTVEAYPYVFSIKTESLLRVTDAEFFTNQIRRFVSAASRI